MQVSAVGARYAFVAKLLVAGFALLALAWAFLNPPGAGPDEAANYVKAVGVGQGQILGARGPLPAAQAAPFSPDALRLAWSSSTTRWVRVPARLIPAGFPQSDLGPAGTQPTYVGTYQPFIYLIPGLATRLAANAIVGVILARLVTLTLCLGLLALACWLLWTPRRGGLQLIGLLLAVSPLVIMVTAVVSASGFEICAGICVFAAVLRIARPDPPSRAVFAAFVVAGIVLALSRPLGVVWLGLDLALTVPLVGPRRLLAIARAGGPQTVLGGVALLATAVIGAGWELAVEPHHHTTLAELAYFIPRALALLPLDFKQAIGIFGWLDTWMPGGAYDLAAAALAVLLIGAFLVGSRRQRLILVLLVVGTIAVTVAIGAAIIMPIGSPLQARYVLAMAVIIPLFAGEVIAGNAERLRWLKPAHLIGGFAALAAVVQAIALVSNTLRFAGPLPEYARDFTPTGGWVPPFGNLAWLTVGLAGCLLLLSAGATAFRRPSTKRPSSDAQSVAA